MILHNFLQQIENHSYNKLGNSFYFQKIEFSCCDDDKADIDPLITFGTVLSI